MDEYDDEVNENGTSIPDSFTFAAVGTMIGLVAVILLVIMSLIFPSELGSIDRAQSIGELVIILTQYPNEALTILVLDTIFIVGYLSLFIGLYMMSRDFADLLPKLALVLGVMVGLLDLVENALLITIIQGFSQGWQPDLDYFRSIFILNSVIDVFSYSTALIFALIFVVIYRPWHKKFILGLLLLIYTIIGLSSVIFPGLLIVRAILFIIGMAYGTVIIGQEEHIPSELLEELLNNQNNNELFR